METLLENDYIRFCRMMMEMNEQADRPVDSESMHLEFKSAETGLENLLYERLGMSVEEVLECFGKSRSNI